MDRLVRARLGEALKPMGVSVTQYTILSVLRARSGLSNAQLARRSYITAQAMHQTLNRLEARGLVERSASPDHGRVQQARLTPSGEDLVDQCDELVDQVESGVFGALGDGDLRRLRTLMERCVDDNR